MRCVPLTPTDIAIASELARVTFTETFGHLYPPEDLSDFLETSYAPAVLLPQVADPAHMWRVLLDDVRGPIGYLHCGPVTLPHPDADHSRQGEIKRIYVRASHQTQGYGKLLMGEALAWLAACYGPEPQWLGVWSGNVKAQTFYASLGFEKAGSYVFPVGQTQDDEYILRRMPTA